MKHILLLTLLICSIIYPLKARDLTKVYILEDLTTAAQSIIDDYSYNSTEVYTTSEVDTLISEINLSELNDVTLTSVASNEVLVYNATSGEWNNKPPDGDFVKKRHFYIPETDTNLGNYRVQEVSSNGQFRFNFMLPDDLHVLDHIYLFFFPDATFSNRSVTFYRSHCVPGDQYNANDSSTTINNYAGIGGEFTIWDITNGYTSAPGCSFCAVRVDHNFIGTSIRYAGVCVQYY